MSNEDIMKEALVETTKQVAEDIYKDTLHPTARNVGGFLGTLSGFFNHVVVYPLKKLNTIFEQKAIAFERNMAIKYGNIPEENRVEPQLHIVGPAMESLKYKIMEDDIAEMYSNLLISDMDNKTQSLCSPAFVKIIEQLSPLDARIFKDLYFKLSKDDIAICNLQISPIDNPDVHYKIDLPTYFLNYNFETLDNFNLSYSIINLQRLGLLEISFVEWFNDEYYEKITKCSLIQHYTKRYKDELNLDTIVRICNKGVVKLTDFSKSFAQVCFRKS